MMMPSWAPRPVPTMIAVGVASPRAHGQAMISTATAAVTATDAGSPAPSQNPRVAAAIVMTTGTNTAAIRSARRWIGALPACASWTSRAIWASLVSAPTRVARTTSRPPALMVPPVTASPGPTSTGTGSPVSSEASIADVPCSTTPSVATFSPGRTTKRSPAPEGVDADTPLSGAVEHNGVRSTELEKGAQGGPGIALRARLEVAAGQDQRRDPGGDLQEDLARRHVAVGDQAETVAQARFAGAAEEQGVQRPPEGGEHPDGDQRVHRRRGVAQVDPGRPVERPSAPHHDRRSEGERQPLPVVELEDGEHPEDDDRQRQDRRHDQAAPSVVDAVVVAYGFSLDRIGLRNMGAIAGGRDGRNKLVECHG